MGDFARLVCGRAARRETGERNDRSKPKTMNTLNRFNEAWMPEPFTGCHLWIKCANNKLYGQIWHNGKMVLAHRLSWILNKGEIPKGMQVLHRCDTPACVNPDHLFLGTNSDNIRDSVSKGRWNIPARKRQPTRQNT